MCADGRPRGDRIGTAEALETIGALAAAADDPERSLRLLAAAAAFHARTGIVRRPHAADAARSARATAWAALGNADAAARWEEGAACRWSTRCPTPAAAGAGADATRSGGTR